MQTVRQVASGLVYAAASALLVIGSLSLALVERGSATLASTATATAPEIVIALASITPKSPSTVTPTYTAITGTPNPTSTALFPTGMPTLILSFPTGAITYGPPSYWSRGCGPYPGWIRGYMVRPGDTLFRIAIVHGTTVSALERANCKTTPAIYSGELLWVPFMLAYPPP